MAQAADTRGTQAEARMSERAKKVLATTFRRDEVTAVVALLRKLSLGGHVSEVGPLARAPAIARVQRKFCKLMAKAGAE